MKYLFETRRALGLAFVFAVGAAAQISAQGRPALQSAAEAIVAGASGEWGVVAWSLDRDVPLISIRAEDIQIPASNNKIFTSIWALNELGPDYRFPTDLLLTGPISDNGVLRGSVVLRGSGDPAFGYPDFTEDSMDPLRIMARRLRALGVRSVEGGVIGDPTVFDTILVGPDWPRDTGGGSAAYAPRVSGLAFQRNLIWIEVEPTSGGGPATITLTPAVEAIPVVNQARTGGGRAWAVRQADDDTIYVKGAVSGSRLHRYRVGVAQPALLAAAALRQALIAEGIAVRGPATVGDTPEDAKLVHRHFSIPLGQMIPKLNQDSDNFFAEHLWKATVADVLGEGSYARGGAASAMFFHDNAGIPYGQLYQFDGSGLSESNRTSALAIVKALQYADQAPWSELFHNSLAVAADPDGTMNRLFRGTLAAGNLHAKTGYINDVRTLSGYVRARNGERIAFSFLYNGRNTFGARSVQSQLGELLAEYGG
ncbi:MAG TPA: D-alanyl-D-alanine carboxypeptidase/D-alanyl-D-alanine-endopeptidase [Longimicrobiaceae bacterium]|nr:D-alanyl-D-alanine carboxypeptidase/D-alanyl-D-alanine-endopeptidase [Longimicrobiaceae bacterium]